MSQTNDIDEHKIVETTGCSALDATVGKPRTRRSFLRGLLTSGAALVAAACGRGDPTPTPTSSARNTATTTPVSQSSLLPTPGDVKQKSYFPFIENGEQVALAPTETPTPADTPTPQPPPPTPTPMATDFPAGPPSKLGLHVERNEPQIFELLDTGAVTSVTTLELDANFAKEIKESKSQPLLIGRVYVEQAQMSEMTDPLGTARRLVDALLPYAADERRRPYFDAWIGYNEPVVNTVEEMQRLAEFEAERTRLLAAEGIRSVIGNFATGNPDLELWPHFFPALEVAKVNGGLLGLHEYSAPTIYYSSTRDNSQRYPGIDVADDGWLTLRYRKVYRQHLVPNGLAIPLVFTECGVDGFALPGIRPGPASARGWRDFQDYWAQEGYGLWGPGAYVEQLVWFDKAMQQDEYVVGGCIYALGTSAQWLSYDIAGPAAKVLEQYLSVHTPAQ